MEVRAQVRGTAPSACVTKSQLYSLRNDGGGAEAQLLILLYIIVKEETRYLFVHTCNSSIKWKGEIAISLELSPGIN